MDALRLREQMDAASSEETARHRIVFSRDDRLAWLSGDEHLVSEIRRYEQFREVVGLPASPVLRVIEL